MGFLHDKLENLNLAMKQEGVLMPIHVQRALDGFCMSVANEIHALERRINQLIEGKK